MQKTITIILGSVIFIASAGVALAGNFPTANPLNQEREEKKALMQARQAERCAAVQEKIAAKTGKFQEDKDRRYNAFQNLKERMEKFSTKLAEKGIDVAQLNADLLVLDGKIQKFADDYAARMAKLEETKNFACGHSNGEFKAKLAEARALSKVVQADAKDIRTYFSTTIKTELKKLWEQKKASAEKE